MYVFSPLFIQAFYSSPLFIQIYLILRNFRPIDLDKTADTNKL